ncbi:MAG: efflux RND transporter permease subunit, partial [Gammaproteobacteria bacterium]|nr:efflux RND transporter permease subunit [Gammaproteobacteria bacterium]
MNHQHDLLGTFANHKVAANLLMVMMLLAGVVALKKLNIQFFPNFDMEIITITTLWSGATAEDIEVGITTPLEQRLRSVDELDSMKSTSAPSISAITLEFNEGTNMITALDQVKQLVDDFNNLPSEAETPRVTQMVNYESIAQILLTGPGDLRELRQLAHRFESELLSRGIDKIDLLGLPEEAIEIALPLTALYETGMGLNEIGNRIEQSSVDIPAGIVGELEGTRELRGLNQQRELAGFENLVVIAEEGKRITVGDIATVQRKAKSGEKEITVDGNKAVVMELRRSLNGDSLRSANILAKWVEETPPPPPPGIEIQVFSERWQLIRDRIMVLVKNGTGGLVMILVILYLFLSSRVAFWVAVGIPVSFMATLAIIYLSGGSINMISLFALIMALGIIVDDAIVVGEDAQAHYDMGEAPLKASEGGARRMLGPVLASSLTTIAAFLPLMLVGGRIGNIMGVIPMVVISVIIASLIESFYILPGHLRNAFSDSHRDTRGRLRHRLDDAFEHFRDRLFRPVVTHAIRHHWSTFAFAISGLILAIGLIVGGRINFHFFPSPESTTVYANVRFVAGSNPADVDRFLSTVEQGLIATREAF